MVVILLRLLVKTSGGLIEDITQHRLPVRYAYLLILLVTVALTWETNVNGIIAYASRAFALYYMLQCIVAFVVCRQTPDLKHKRRRLAGFAFLSLACFLVFRAGSAVRVRTHHRRRA